MMKEIIREDIWEELKLQGWKLQIVRGTRRKQGFFILIEHLANLISLRDGSSFPKIFRDLRKCAVSLY